MRRSFALLLFVLSALACSSTPISDPNPRPTSSTSVTPPGLAEGDQPLPLDARVKKGKLDNGLTYYILPHAKPEKRAQIWLAVNAGSLQEDDDQRGLAHFVEHMGFNGTKRFPKQELVDFLESSGVRFGPDLNAYTSFDETVYMLQVPTDKDEIVAKAITVLRDWADGMSFESAEVEKERGVVLEEWRRGRGARARIFDKQAPVLFHKSRYAERLTIGKPEIIQGAPREALVRFYKDWYRPDLMAVVAVGDFDVEDVEKKIKEEFSSLAAPPTPRPRPAVEVPAHAETLVSIETDPELPNASVSIMTKTPRKPNASANDYRRSVAERLFSSMLSERLDEIRRQPDAPFLAAGAYTSTVVRGADAFSQSASVSQDGVEKGIAALIEELLRVERHGFTATELERAKAQMLRSFQATVKERDKVDGHEYAAEIVRNYFVQEAMPGREAELALVEKFLPTFTLEELNGLAKTLAAGSRVITVTGPAMMAKPTAASLLALEKDVAKRDIEPYLDAGPSEPLMAQKPTPGTVTATKTIPEIGVTEWTLSNGARVIVKPTDFKNDEVRMSAYSAGGTSLASDADFVNAKFADAVVRQGGIGKLDAVQLRKALAGKLVSVTAGIAELEEGVSGRASPGDLETMFQLMHLSFTSPRKDEVAFKAWRDRESEALKNRRLSPEQTFQEEMTVFANQNHPRRQPTTPEMLAKIDLDKAMAFYKDRFADAGDFTFLFVGNVELEPLKKFVETYIASLPGGKRKENWKDPKVVYPTGVKTKVIEKGSEPRSVVVMTFHGNEKYSRDGENDMAMVTEALSHRLRQVLREDMGGVYGVQAGGSLSRRPKQQYSFTVAFTCSPDNVEKLKKAVLDEVKAVQDKGVADDLIAKIKETRRRYFEVAKKDNGFWIRELEIAYTYGDDPKQIIDVAPLIEKVTAERIKKASAKYTSDKQYMLGVLMPDKK